MLKVKTKLKVSSINGIGLFADQNISKGTLVWIFHPNIDFVFDLEKKDYGIPKETQDVIKHYGYQNNYGQYILPGDDARFFNHSEKPNCFEMYSMSGKEPTIATRRIKKGEELTIDYSSFDKSYKDKLK